MTNKQPLLKWGSRDPLVSTLQQFLNKHTKDLKPKLKVDGIFGKLTYAAVKKFQKQQKTLKDDGIVGPKTWGKINSIEKIDDKSQYPSVPGASLTLQKTPHDCGFYSGYFLAKCNANKTVQGVSFSERDVLDAKNRFLKANRLPDVYLGPHNVPGFLKSIGLANFRSQPHTGIFRYGSDDMAALRYVIQRLGNTGIMVALQSFVSGGGSGHWLAIASVQKVKNDVLFLVYDSSGRIPNNRRREGMPAGTCLCWVRAGWLIPHLKAWMPGAMISRV